jgi:APA family basic amino acid/polyamine antiporter
MTLPKKAKIGFWTLLCLVMGNMIGSGVFSLPASLARYGSISLLGWAFTAGGSLLIALIFSKLSQEAPNVGGPYAYCKQGLGDFMGFQVAWNYWISMWVGSSATVVMVVGYLAVFFPSLSHNTNLGFGCGLLIIWGLTGLNMLSIQGSGKFQIITTVLKILPLAAIIIWGIPEMNFDHFQAFNVTEMPNSAAFIATATLTMWTFIGLESATIPSQHVENPHRVIPLATIMGTLLVAIIYMITETTMIGLIPNDILQNAPAPFALAAEKLFGHFGALAIALGAIIAALGSLNGFILIQSQIPMAAARDKLFPSLFAHTSRHGTPIRVLLITGSIMSFVLWMNYDKSLVEQFTFLITLATLAALTTYLFSIVSEVIISMKKRKTSGKKMPIGSIALSLGAFIYVIWAIIGAGAEIFFYGSILFFASTPLFVLVKWQRGKN